MSAFAIPDQAPDAASVLTAVQNSLNAVPRLKNALRDAAKVYVAGLAQLNPPGTVLTASAPPAEVAHYDELERGVVEILEAHGEEEDKDTNRDTLVHGPDTTHRMLQAHLSEKGLFTMDVYPFSTKLPMKSAIYKAFTWDESFEDDDTAKELWNLFIKEAKTVYAQRAIEAGLEVVWGRPVRQAYEQGAYSLGAGWSWIASTAIIAIPGIENAHNTFPPTSYRLDWQLAYRPMLGTFEFGKLVLFHVHPSKSGALKNKGFDAVPEGWSQALVTDALVRLLYLASTGSLSPPLSPTDTFAYVARPYPALNNYDNGLQVISIQQLRAQEIAAGENFTREYLDALNPNIMVMIERHNEIDETSEDSILRQACSQSSKRGQSNISAEDRKRAHAQRIGTLGPEGRSAAAQKSVATKGFEGLSKAALKAKATQGPQGIKEAAAKMSITKGKDGLRAQGETARQTWRKKARPSRLPVLPADDKGKLAWLDYVHDQRQKLKLKTGDSPKSIDAKRGLLPKLLATLFKPQVHWLRHRSADVYKNWPKGMSFEWSKMNSDEMDYLGAMMITKTLQVRDDLKA